MNAIITGEHLTDIDKHFLIVEPMENTKEWEDWDMECNKIDAEISKFNNEQIAREDKREAAMNLLDKLVDLGYDGFGSEVWNWIMALPKPEDLKNSEKLYPPEPKQYENSNL